MRSLEKKTSQQRDCICKVHIATAPSTVSSKEKKSLIRPVCSDGDGCGNGWCLIWRDWVGEYLPVETSFYCVRLPGSVYRSSSQLSACCTLYEITIVASIQYYRYSIYLQSKRYTDGMLCIAASIWCFTAAIILHAGI